MEKSASTDEMLDFFSLRSSAFPPLRRSIDHQRSFNGIDGVISRMNPQLLKSEMASGAMSSSMPVYVPFQRSRVGIESSEVKAPLTIFYNGTVRVFDVSGHKICQWPGGYRCRDFLRSAKRGCLRHPLIPVNENRNGTDN